MREIRLVVSGKVDERIDKYLSDVRGLATRSQVQRLLRQGHVLVEGKRVKPSFHLRGGETLTVTIPPPEPATVEAQDIPIDVIYEDRHLLVVNKAAGMVVHPGSGVRRGTLVNALLARCKDLSGIGGVLRPGIVHRLDKGTSGLLIVAKDDGTHQRLSQDLAARKIKRTYEAVVWGVPKEKEGRVETLFGRSRSDRKKMAVLREKGRVAVTLYRVAEEFGFASRLLVSLQTGRTHQIRVHLAHSGHPVFGDPTYGGRRRKYGSLPPSGMSKVRELLSLIDRQALHASKIRFTHPAKNEEMEFKAPLPEDMERLISSLREIERKGGVR